MFNNASTFESFINNFKEGLKVEKEDGPRSTGFLADIQLGAIKLISYIFSFSTGSSENSE